MGEEEIKVPRDKFELRKYLESFNLRDSNVLAERASEIIGYVRVVMGPYACGERGSDYKEYYEPAVRLMERAYVDRDFVKDFPDALDFMIGSIEWD